MNERLDYLRKNFPTLQEVIKFANPTEEEQTLLDYKGTSNRMIGTQSFMLNEMIVDAFNTRPDGSKWIPNWKNYDEKKHFAVYDMDSAKHPSGVGFSGSDYAYWDTRADCGSRLALEFGELVALADELYPDVFINLLTKQNPK